MSQMLAFRVMPPDLGGVKRKLGPAARRAAQAAFAQRVMRDSNAFCMVDTGDTQQSAGIGSSGDEISWTTPYARYAYYSSSARTAVNPLAHVKWFEHAKSVRLGTWESYARRLLS